VYTEWKRQQRTPFVPLEATGASMSDPLDPEESADAAQLLEVILSHLSASEQHLVRLTVAGHTLQEIAATLGISYEAAGTRVHRVRMTIRKWLNDSGL
jgi:RNA polymerase sigma factor (sigma-70 family)